MQFSGNSMQKRVNPVQRSNKPDWTFLELFSRTMSFLRFKDVKISLYIIVLIVRGCFERMHSLNKLFFALDARALLLHNYDRLSRIFFHVYY